MEHGLSDTDPETERVHLELLQRASPARRIRLALSLSRTVMSLSRGGLARRMPDASPEEVGLRFVALHYGADLADDLLRRSGRAEAVTDPDLLATLTPVLRVLGDLGVRHSNMADEPAALWGRAQLEQDTSVSMLSEE
jgi:hypothetical protein